MTNDFYPCFTDERLIKANVAFGWPDFYNRASIDRNVLFVEYLLGKPEINELFERETVEKLVIAYLAYASDIDALHYFVRAYLDGTLEPAALPIKYKPENMINTWRNRISELYEKFRTDDTIFGRTLYGQLLVDFLWNPYLDPFNPKVIEGNISSYRPAIPLSEAYEWEDSDQASYETLIQEAESGIFERVKKTLTPNRYKFSIDNDGAILIKKNLKADLPDAFRKVNRLLKLYNDRGRFDEMKPYLAELYFINELIEMKYVYNHHMTEKEKAAYKDHIDLRSNVLSTFKLYLGAILEHDSSFDFQGFYDASPFANVLTINREQLKGIRNMISVVLLGK